MASKDSEADRLRQAIVGALNLLSATDWDTILGTLPNGGPHTERMCERLRDHLRQAIGLEPVESGPPDPYADAVADRWLAVTDQVQDSWQHPVRRGRQHPSRHVRRGRRSPVSVMRDARTRGAH